MQILENEISKLLLEFMENKNVDFQLVPAHIHWKNATEQSIRTCKNHFLSIISTVDDGFPMHLWNWILDQSYRTLNLLLPARINPTISSYNMIWGSFYFGSIIMGPPGWKIIFHENPGKRVSRAFHGLPGFLIGPFMNGYCTYKVYIPKTRT